MFSYKLYKNKKENIVPGKCLYVVGVSSCVWMEGCAYYASGVQEEPNGDCEEANGAYGQSWRHNIQRWVAFKNYSDLFSE